MEKVKCLKCGYEWQPRIKTRPVKCPECQSRDWDGKRNNKKE